MMRVIGIGQPVAGDDGVGPAVVDALRAMTLPANVEIHQVRDASALLPHLDESERVVVIDAVLEAGEPGTVHAVALDALDTSALSGVSSHGLGVAQAVALARTLDPGAASDVRFVAVSIAPPDTYQEGLSQAVANAVPAAASRVLALLAEPIAAQPLQGPES